MTGNFLDTPKRGGKAYPRGGSTRVPHKWKGSFCLQMCGTGFQVLFTAEGKCLPSVWPSRQLEGS